MTWLNIELQAYFVLDDSPKITKNAIIEILYLTLCKKRWSIQIHMIYSSKYPLNPYLQFYNNLSRSRVMAIFLSWVLEYPIVLRGNFSPQKMYEIFKNLIENYFSKNKAANVIMLKNYYQWTS